MTDIEIADQVFEAMEGPECDTCQGYNYELLGCCGGHECGCRGQPVDAKACPQCNPDGKREPSLEAKKDWPHFFLTQEEWNKHHAK